MQWFTRRVVDIIRDIPPGKIMTYGQIAAVAGSPRAARQVVRILHSLSEKERLPWHRVMNAKGKIGLQDEEGRLLQTMLLEGEGIQFGVGGRVDLDVFLYRPAMLPGPDDIDQV